MTRRISPSPFLGVPSVYSHPRYFDLAFQPETKREADFIEAAGRKYVPFPVRRMLEPGCGGGRLLVELARRGFHVTGLDLNPAMVQYTRLRLRSRQLPGAVLRQDMERFGLPKGKGEGSVDLAFCTFNTFRHLLSEAAARRHLESVARALRPGGIYILGLHLLPPDAAEQDCERWTVRRGSTRVTTTIRVLRCDRRRRIETLRFSLRVRSSVRDLRIHSDFDLRLYTARQMRSLLASVPAFELLDVYDFWYEIDSPLRLSDEMSDTVFILRRRLVQ